MWTAAVLLMTVAIQPNTEGVLYRQPQLAAGHGQTAMVFGAGNTIYFVSSPDKGASFAAPVEVAKTGALALGRHRGPRLAILKEALVISAIAGERVATGPHAHGLPEAGNLLTWRSLDRGKTWQRGGPINDVPGAAREGLHAMASAPDGRIFAVWLDLRNKGTQLWGAWSKDGGVTWSKNQVVYSSPDGSICQCCHPSLSIDLKGKVWVMWRNVVDGSRDLWLTTSDDGQNFTAATKLGSGTWKLNACPMDGGGMAIDNGKVITAWRRDGELFLASDGNAETKVGSGKDVALVKTKAGVYLAWTQDGGIQLQPPGEAQPRAIARQGGFPALLDLEDGSVLVAWEAQGRIESLRVSPKK